MTTMNPPLPGVQRKERLSTRARKRITAFSKGLSEILAGLAEPGMRYATIYMALATGIPAINWGPAFNFCEGLVIALPEFVLIGAFGIAEDAWREGKKVWGGALYMACIALALIVGATLVDIFIWQYPAFYIKLLNFSRCLIAVSFSVILGKLDEGKSEDEGPVQNAAILNIQPIQAPIQPVHLEEIGLLTEEVNRLSAMVLQMSQTVNVYISQYDIDRQMDKNRQTHVQPIQEVYTPVQGSLQQIAAPGVNESDEVPEVEDVEPDETVIAPLQGSDDGSVQADMDSTCTNASEPALQAVYPHIQGISPEVVQIVIDERLNGTSWSAIASKTGKNYSRIVKPIREAYTQICTDGQAV
jgi:hypothetical protein